MFAGVADQYRGRVIDYILCKLREIAQWFSTQQKLQFRGSSILIVFESDKQALVSCLGDGTLSPSSNSVDGSNPCTSNCCDAEISEDKSRNSFSTNGSVDLSKLLQVKMIDFVHVSECNALDLNYLEGLTSVIKYFTDLSSLFISASTT